MAIIKRDKKSSNADLVKALDTLIPLLEDEKEVEASEALNIAMDILTNCTPGGDEHKAAVASIIDAFEGEHELMAYTVQRKNAGDQWTKVEQLSQASSRVITLARRVR